MSNFTTPDTDTRLRTTDAHLREDEPRAPRSKGHRLVARVKVKE